MSYYQILELQPGSTTEEVKKAYRRLAMKWHPDRNNNSKVSEERFKLIKQAYEALTDPSYKYVPPPPKPEPAPQSAKQYTYQNRNVVKAEPDANVLVSLGDLYTGVRKHARKKTLCPMCNGTGNKEVFRPGSIGETVWRNKGYSQYRGENDDGRCKPCKGLGEITAFDCWFDIPPGVPDKTVMQLSRLDSDGRHRGGFSNIKVYVGQKGDRFEYRDGHLYDTVTVNNRQLLEGFKHKVCLPNGRWIEAIIPQALEDGMTVRIANVGPPNFNSGEPGHLYLKLKKFL